MDEEKIIEAYYKGQSMNSIAKDFHTYATTIQRLLKKRGIKTRPDVKRKGTLYVKEGEKLIEWAKAQGRPVTRAELAKIAGTKRLSPSYFIKYPELGQYVVSRDQKELQEYNQKLYNWLQKNNIPYKPNDRTKLNMYVTALLLGEYEGLAIQVNIRPSCVSKKKYEEIVEKKLWKAPKAGLSIIWLDKKYFDDLDEVKKLLDTFKK